MGPGNARGGGSVREAEGSGLGIRELGKGGFGGVTVGEERGLGLVRKMECRVVTDSTTHVFKTTYI